MHDTSSFQKRPLILKPFLKGPWVGKAENLGKERDILVTWTIFKSNLGPLFFLVCGKERAKQRSFRYPFSLFLSLSLPRRSSLSRKKYPHKLGFLCDLRSFNSISTLQSWLLIRSPMLPFLWLQTPGICPCPRRRG